MAISIEYEGVVTDWGAKVQSLSSITKNRQSPEGFIDISPVTIGLADTENELWGSWYSSTGTQILGSSITIKYDGTTAYTGDVQSVKWKNSLCNMQIADQIMNLKRKGFEWDWERAGTSLGGTEHWGTVQSVLGSCIYLNDAIGTDYYYTKHKFFKADKWKFEISTKGIKFNIWIGYRHVKRLEEDYFDYDLIADDFVVGGNEIVFDGKKLSGSADHGTGPFCNHNIYTVARGTFINNKGTVELDTFPADVRPGDFIYIRQPIVIHGNAEGAIKQTLQGSNTIDPVADANIDLTSLTTASRRAGPLNCVETITENDNVLDVLNGISHDIGIYFSTTPANKIQAKYYGPYQWTEVDQTGYNQTKDIEQGFGFGYDSKDLVSQVTTDYNFISGTEDNSESVRRDVTSPTIDNIKDLNLQWLHNKDEAIVFADRYCLLYGTAIAKMKVGLTRFATWDDIGTKFALTHDRGSFATRHVEIVQHSKDIFGSRSMLEVEDCSRLGSAVGYGWWGAGEGTDSYGGYDDTITGTSPFGWSMNIYPMRDKYSSKKGTIRGMCPSLYATLGATGTTIKLLARHWAKLGRNQYYAMGSYKFGTQYNLGTDSVTVGQVNWCWESIEVIKISGTKYQTGTEYFADVIRGQMDTATRWHSGYEPLFELNPCPDYGTGTCKNMGNNYGTAGFRWW